MKATLLLRERATEREVCPGAKIKELNFFLNVIL